MKDVECEAFLVRQARVLDLDGLRQIARRLELTLDPDGTFKDLAYRERQRDFRLAVRADRSSHGTFELTAALTERSQGFFDATARPKPAVDGTQDRRTAGQRRHDALHDGLTLLARAELLPDTGGVATTLMLTMTLDAFTTGDGTATTGHGIVLPAKQALMWCDGDTRIVPILFDTTNERVISIGTG